jgi:hypothetical protein
LLSNTYKLKAGLAAVTAVVALAMIVPAGASANCGGGGISSAEVDICTPTPKARLLANGMLIPPKAAPPRVKAVIAAANRIRTKPYIYGGGHGKWWDRGYDCSGSVSYVMHAAGLLESPLDSTGFMRWGGGGAGSWVRVYANREHVFAVIAGLRWDTSMTEDGDASGPGWSEYMRSGKGFRLRHPLGLLSAIPLVP